MAGPRDARDALLLVNPFARRAADAQSPEVAHALAARFDVAVLVPTSPAAVAEAAAGAAAAGAAAVIAAGGDGTVRRVAGALAGSRTALGVLPAGTANDAARALGLPLAPAAAARRIAAAAPREVDLVEVAAGDRRDHFLTVGGLGVVTAAALRATRLRRGGRLTRAVAAGLGAGVYRAAATAALLTPDARVRRYALDVVRPDGVREGVTLDAHGAFVANLPYCGGGLRVPGAGPADDGTVALCFVAAAPRPLLAARFARLAAGLPVGHPAVHVVAAREAHVRCDAHDALLGDGELLATGRAFSFRTRRSALRVLA